MIRNAGPTRGSFIAHFFTLGVYKTNSEYVLLLLDGSEDGIDGLTRGSLHPRQVEL